jgi:hypothetical protein
VARQVVARQVVAQEGDDAAYVSNLEQDEFSASRSSSKKSSDGFRNVSKNSEANNNVARSQNR